MLMGQKVGHNDLGGLFQLYSLSDSIWHGSSANTVKLSKGLSLTNAHKPAESAGAGSLHLGSACVMVASNVRWKPGGN